MITWRPLRRPARVGPAGREPLARPPAVPPTRDPDLNVKQTRVIKHAWRIIMCPKCGLARYDWEGEHGWTVGPGGVRYDCIGGRIP